MGVVAILSMFIMQSCGGVKNLVIPHSVSTVGVTTVKDLDLKSGQYEILKTIQESASITCEYKSRQMKIKSNDGDFAYTFSFNDKTGWSLASFNGAASFGYFTDDYSSTFGEIPSAEEFARRVAMARIINAVADFGADGVVEPVTTTRVSNAGKNTVEFQTTVRAKLIKIKPTK